MTKLCKSLSKYTNMYVLQQWFFTDLNGLKCIKSASRTRRSNPFKMLPIKMTFFQSHRRSDLCTPPVTMTVTWTEKRLKLGNPMYVSTSIHNHPVLGGGGNDDQFISTLTWLVQIFPCHGRVLTCRKRKLIKSGRSKSKRRLEL